MFPSVIFRLKTAALRDNNHNVIISSVYESAQFTAVFLEGLIPTVCAFVAHDVITN